MKTCVLCEKEMWLTRAVNSYKCKERDTKVEFYSCIVPQCPSYGPFPITPKK